VAQGARCSTDLTFLDPPKTATPNRKWFLALPAELAPKVLYVGKPQHPRCAEGISSFLVTAG
jgi:hypothetical protein